MPGLCFSIHGCFSFKKLFFNFYIFASMFSIDIKNIPIIFKEVLKINEKLSILEFAKLSPS